MRLDAVLGPDPRDSHVRDIAQFRRRLARRPVRRAIGWLVLGGASQNARLDPIRDFVALAAGVPRKQPCQSLRRKALAPTRDATVIAVKLAADIGPSVSF
jgi:hypothetical protein